MSEVRLIDNAACSHALHVQVEHLVLLFDGEPYAFTPSAEQGLRLVTGSWPRRKQSRHALSAARYLGACCQGVRYATIRLE